MTRPLVAVVSAGRPGNVPKMEALLNDLAPVWFVPEDQVGDYRFTGARDVRPAGGLIESRNQALEEAFAADRPCVQVSDDLKRVEWTPDGKTKQPITAAQAVRKMLRALEDTGLYLAGVAPTPNAYFWRKPLHTDAFIVGDLVAILPSEPRFDPTLRLKEDYDFTLQHQALYGGAARVNGVLAHFQHRTNRGGAVAVRTPELEQEAIAYLTEKWPGRVRPNPRRENEILLIRA